MAETIANPASSSQKNLINPLTGFLSKAADTALEIALVREGRKADSKMAIGTVAPSGQVDPARVQSDAVTASQPETPQEQETKNSNTVGMVVGISAATVVVLGVLFLAAKSGKKK